MAQSTHARCIVGFSLSGATLRALSAARGRVPIYGAVADEKVQRRLQLHWGLSVITLPLQEDLTELIETMLTHLRREGIYRSGDTVVVVAGTREPGGGTGHLLKVKVLR